MSETPYGFNWGPLTVERCMEYRGSHVLLVKSDTHTLEIAVSPKGNNIRAWLDGNAMTVSRDDS